MHEQNNGGHDNRSSSDGYREHRPPAMHFDGNAESAIETDDDDGTSGLMRTQSRSSEVQLAGSYCRPSFAFGQTRPSFVPASPIATAIDTLSSSEREYMIVEERELLKGNLLGTSYGTMPESDNFPTKRIGAPSVLDETTLLIAASLPTEEWEEAVGQGAIHTTYTREAQVLFKNSVPLYIAFALQYSLTVASIFAAGNLGKNELAGVSLASMTAMITGWAPYQGCSTALDTLCAQAYGSGKKQLVGLHLQRMIYFLMVLSVPIIVLWQFSEPILNAMVPEPELVVYASLYLRILCFGAPGYAIFEASKRFVQAQGLFFASTCVLIVCAPFNAILNYVLVWHPKFGIGFVGAPISVVITNWLMCLLLFLYVKYIDGYQCWGGFSRRSLQNWWPMIKLAIPGFIMLEAEYLAFEVLTLVAARFGTAYLAAQSVLGTASTLAYQLPFAVSIATSTRVANFLGATLGDAARIAGNMGILASMCIGLFNSVLVMAMRYKFIKLFSQDPEVIGLFVKSIPIGGAFQFFDAIGVLTAGILRGQGKQHIGGYINLIAYYAFGVPISMVLAFVFDWKLPGLWTGVALSLCGIAIVESVIIYRSDWGKIVDETKERVNEA